MSLGSWLIMASIRAAYDSDPLKSQFRHKKHISRGRSNKVLGIIGLRLNVTSSHTAPNRFSPNDTTRDTTK